MDELIQFVVGSPLALTIIIVGLLVLGYYGNWRRKRDRQDLAAGIRGER